MLASTRHHRRLIRKTRATASELFYKSPVSKLVQPRRTHVYCVGTAKSGTHSLEALFNGRLRVYHEADWKNLIGLILGVAEGRVSPEAFSRHLRARDRRFSLDIDSSQLNYFFVRELVELFPEAKFILTLRDPYSWLDSLFNHQLARRHPPYEWRRLRDLRFGSPHAHPPEEHALEVRGLYTLDGYLSYWAAHNRRVLEVVPEDRLLVVRTDEITPRAEEIRRFAGVSHAAARPTKSHTYKALAKFGVLGDLDAEYLAGKISEHCAQLMGMYFPVQQVTPGYKRRSPELYHPHAQGDAAVNAAPRSGGGSPLD